MRPPGARSACTATPGSAAPAFSSPAWSGSTSVWTQPGIFSGTPPEGDPISGEKDLHVVADPGVPADVVVTGRASDVDAWLWRRRDDDGITVTGDREVYALARAVLDQPL